LLSSLLLPQGPQWLANRKSDLASIPIAITFRNAGFTSATIMTIPQHKATFRGSSYRPRHFFACQRYEKLRSARSATWRLYTQNKLNGNDLRTLPLIERKRQLRNCLVGDAVLQRFLRSFVSSYSLSDRLFDESQHCRLFSCRTYSPILPKIS
jgi:hypothetical protein